MSMSEPLALHVFLEVPCQNLMFFQRFHVRTSCFFGGSMSEPPVLQKFFFRRFHVCTCSFASFFFFFLRFHIKTSCFVCYLGGSITDSFHCSNSLETGRCSLMWEGCKRFLCLSKLSFLLNVLLQALHLYRMSAWMVSICRCSDFCHW